MNARHGAVVLACAAWFGLASSARASEWTQTSTADFAAGTLSNASLMGVDGTLRLAASVEAWTQIPGPGASDLFGLHMISNTAAWAVGTKRADAYNSYNAARYDGSAWSNDSTVSNGADLYSLWMNSGNEGWAIGASSRLLAYDRPEWYAEVDYMTPAVALGAVHFVARPDGWSEGWAVGASGVILNFDGSGWTPFSSPTTSGLRGVSMVSPVEGWIVGVAGTILRYDGASWTNAASPTGNTLNSVSMLPSGKGWAVGASGTILRYDGSSWSEAVSPTDDNLSSVRMVSEDEGWAVGDAGVILRCDGSAWTAAVSPVGDALKAVSFGSPERGLAVGLSGTTVKYERDYFAAGTFVSSVFNGGGSPSWTELTWSAAGTAPGVAVKFQVATGDADPPTNFRGPDGTAGSYYTSSGQALWSGHGSDRYIRYKALFSTDNPVLTPRLESVTIGY